MSGLEPLPVANEGKIVCVVAASDAPTVLRATKHNSYATNAARIGTICPARPPVVELLTRTGGRRIVQRPYGEDLPRIC